MMQQSGKSRKPTRLTLLAGSGLLAVLFAAVPLYPQALTSLPADFPVTAISFQQYNGDTGQFLPLRFAGNQTIGPNGNMISTGPLYTSQFSFNPYAFLDSARNCLFLHPAKTEGSIVSAGIPTSGTYTISGAFARANDFLNAGDGVRVVAFVNNQIGAPRFEAVIASSHVVDTNSFFSGSGVAPFSFTASLAKGDTVQFAVFSGPSQLDADFDITALQFTITGAGVSISLPSAFPVKPLLFQEYDSVLGRFTPLKFAGNQTVGPNGDVTSTGPVYATQTDLYPYAMLDKARNLFMVHPLQKKAAVVSAGISTSGTYTVSGTFARANDFQFAGDGVRVLVFVNNQIGTPRFDATISSANVVNPNVPFSGPGLASFSFSVSLVRGDAVQFAVLSGPNQLDATFDVTALQFAITPSGAPPCTFSLSSAQQAFGMQGGLSSFAVTSAATCSWNASRSASWITILPSGSKGTGKVNYAVSANSGSARTGSITVGDQSYKIEQQGFGCSYSINPAVAAFNNSGGTARIVVTAPVGCPWTSISNAGWLQTSTASGSGTGAVVVTAATNAGGSRSGTVTIAGRTLSATQGAGACGAIDVTSLTSLNLGPFVMASINLSTQTISVLNKSPGVIRAPVYVAFVGQPTHYGDYRDTGLAVAPGLTTCFTALGDYLLPLSDVGLVGDLQPNQRITFTLTWINPFHPNYTAKVLSGTPSH